MNEPNTNIGFYKYRDHKLKILIPINKKWKLR